MDQPTPEITNKIRELIAQDLEPALHLVQTKLGLAVGAGACLALAVCGQFGIGLTPWAHVLGHQMHTQMSSVVCALVCGGLFALFPTLLLRFGLCSPMQFQVLLRRYLGSLMLWYAALVGLLAYFGEHGQGFWELIAWLLAALFCTQALAFLLRRWPAFTGIHFLFPFRKR